MPDTLRWYQARDSCVSQGGRLAEVDNAEINNVLKAKTIGKEESAMNAKANTLVRK